MDSRKLRAIRPSGIYVAGTYVMLVAGVLGFVTGLWNAGLSLSEKGFYFITLVFGLFAAISLQRVIRDGAEGIPVTSAYRAVCNTALGLALLTIVVGLWNASLLMSEKGFYAACFLLSLFSVITAQKNTRDILALTEIGVSHEEI